MIYDLPNLSDCAFLDNHGLCRALSYIIQSLSAEAAFAQCLTSPVKVRIPAKWQTVGTTADFMITVSLVLVRPEQS